MLEAFVIYDAPASEYEWFVWKNYEQPLEELRALAHEFEGSNKGIIVVGNIGLTSHAADILRLSRIPSYLFRR